MSRAMTWLGSATATAAGVTVTYTRSGVGHSVTAIPGEVADEVPVTTPPTRADVKRRDYLIAVADLAAAGVSGAPQVGDRITETLNGVSCVFELQRLPDGDAWRYSDAERTTYRVHTKPVS